MPAPFVDQPFTFTQPDGTSIRVRGTGNQFAAVFETEDGYTVTRDPATGYYHYAQRSADGAALLPFGPRVGAADPGSMGIPRNLRAGGGSAVAGAADGGEVFVGEPRWEERRRERAAAGGAAAGGAAGAAPEPVVLGEVVGLCLLVEFPDVPAKISRQEIDDFCNKPGYTGFGNKGSVHDYFLDVSGGRLRYRNVVTPYFTAAHARSYYTDRNISYGVRAQELIREGLTHLQQGGFDLGQLTPDPGGFVYALNVFYAGTRINNWAEGLWPHQGSLTPTFPAGGGVLRDYQIADITDELKLRTFCHENGHMVLDYPDLYVYPTSPTSGYSSFGVGNYCLMGFGGSETNPVQINGYLKNLSGWSDSVTPVVPGTEQSVRAGVNDSLVHRRSATEYFVIENRQQVGRDGKLPDEGLLIWHVDETGDNRRPNPRYELALEQADGTFDLEHAVDKGDATDLYGPGQTFGASTTPNSCWWDGTPSGLEIISITASGPVTTIRTGGPGEELAIPDFGVAQGWRVDAHPRFVADTTGDGQADVVGFGDAGVSVARSNGDGTFGAAHLLLRDFGFDQGWRIDQHPRFLADTTGNRRCDVVGFGNHGVSVALSRPDGTFDSRRLALADFGANQGWRVDTHLRFLADTTGDGRADVVGFGNSGVSVARSKGDGTFRERALAVSDFGADQGWRVDTHLRLLADTTGDGRADVVGFGNSGISVALANGDGTFGPRKLLLTDFGVNQGWRVDTHPRYLADTTGDGRPDVVGFHDDGVYLSRALPGGGYAPAKLVVPNFGHDQGWRIDRHMRFLADTTGDGRADIVGFGDEGIWIAFVDDGGGFGPPVLEVPDFGYDQGWRVDQHPRVLARISGGRQEHVIAFGAAGVRVHHWLPLGL